MARPPPDDRDNYRPKHHTPAVGVRGSTPTPPDEWDDPTPPVVSADPLQHLAYRHRRLSMSVDNLQLGLRTLEAQSQVQAVETARLTSSLQGISGQLDILVRATEGDRDARVELAEAARSERVEREARKKDKEEREEKAKREEREARMANRKLTLSIVVPTVAAIGAAIAAIIAAYSGGGSSAPPPHQPPAISAPAQPGSSH